MADETGALVPAEEELQDTAEELELAGDSGESGEQASQDQGETTEEHKRLSGAQRSKLRIQRLERELDKWRETALGFAQNRPAVEAKKDPAPVEDKRPRKDDFIVDKEAGTYDADKYEDALLDWNRRQSKKELLDEIDKRERSRSQQTEQHRIEQTWREREAPIEAKYDDYQELTTTAITFLQRNAHSPTAQALGAAITESEAGPELLRKLGEDFDTLERISKLSPTAAVRELGKIEARLAPEESAEEDEAEEPESTVPPVKQPPKPPTPVKKVSSVKKPDIYDEKLPFKEFVKLREAQIKGK